MKVLDAPASPPPQPPPWPPPGPLSEPRRRRSLIIGGIVVAVLAAAGGGAAATLLTRGSHPSTPGGGAQSTPRPTSAASAAARALYNQAIAAARASQGFHYVATTDGPESQKIVGDAGQSGGRQEITFNSTYGAEQFTLLLVGQTVYFQGNVPALLDQLGVSDAKAPGLAGTWVSVAPGDGPYNVLHPGITVADQAQETALVPGSTSQVTASDGTTATRITGTVPPQQGAPSGSGYLDVAPSSHLPITYATTISANGITLTGNVSFSGWGTAPVVSAPSGAAAWTSLGATPPPGGYGSGGGSASPSSSPPLSV